MVEARALPSLLRVTVLPLNTMLGRSPIKQRDLPMVPTPPESSLAFISLQQAGSGHLPTPSASTGWHWVGVMSSYLYNLAPRHHLYRGLPHAYQRGIL